MQIMIYLDNMLFLLSTLQYPLLHIPAHILPTLDQFTPHPQTLVEVFQKLPALTITGMAHQFLVNYQLRMLFLPWIFIITVGSTIHLRSLQIMVVLVVLISLQCLLLLRGQLGPVLIYQDLDLSCLLSLLATGMMNFDLSLHCAFNMDVACFLLYICTILFSYQTSFFSLCSTFFCINRLIRYGLAKNNYFINL